jgi:hypothetical protein
MKSVAAAVAAATGVLLNATGVAGWKLALPPPPPPPPVLATYFKYGMIPIHDVVGCCCNAQE